LGLANLSGSPVWIARTQNDWATALGDRDDLRGAAHSAAVELGMASLADRAKPVTTHKASCAVILPHGLSAREAEVLGLIAKGLSNRTIGARLFISANTVANHVRTILQKTGCSNRTEAAAYAERNQLVTETVRTM
jgi:DNA-binding NarL/FixJ family response regulator